MKRLVLVLLGAVGLAVPALALDTPAPAPTSPTANLAKPYTVTLGDMIAFTISQYPAVQKHKEPWGTNGLTEASFTTRYDHDSNKIVIEIFGFSGNTPVDQAKKSVEGFRTRYVPLFRAAVNNAYHVNLSDSDLVIDFIDWDTRRPVIRRDGDKYLVSE